MLLWTSRRVPLYVFAIPLAWTFLGFWAAISLEMIEDLGLLVAGLIGSLLIVLRDTFITQASANGAAVVDWYTASIGHDACKPPAVRWVEPMVPVNAAAPVHPNLGGMLGVAPLVARAVRGG